MLGFAEGFSLGLLLGFTDGILLMLGLFDGFPLGLMLGLPVVAVKKGISRLTHLHFFSIGGWWNVVLIRQRRWKSYVSMNKSFDLKSGGVRTHGISTRKDTF